LSKSGFFVSSDYFLVLHQNFNTMAVKNKSFDDWLAQDVRYTFGIKEVDKLDLLTDWLSHSFSPDAVTAAILETKRLKLRRFFRSWNEDELKLQFIAHLIDLGQFNGQDYNMFSQRMLTATVNGVVLRGKPEVMIAKGQEEPTRPYFFIHEYKPTKTSGEPLGQVLSAMVAAYNLNGDEKPILGCFVIAQTWQFLIFDGQNYALSKNYDATKEEDLMGIYSALCQAKVYIEERVQATV
jgi:hypothetical protein